MGILKDPQAYYWKLDNNYSTGENTGAVIDSLCQIMGQNTIENGDSVVFVPGSGGAKGHFELGESGGGEIPADEGQILIGDGDNWAQGGAFNIEEFISPMIDPHDHWWALTARTEENLDELAEGIIIQGNKEKTFTSPVPDSKSGRQFTIPSIKLPYLALRENSYVLFDEGAYVKINSSDIQITEKARIEMVGLSELRLRDGASIRGTTVNNEIQFQFDDGTDSVSFTIAELKYLKRFIGTLPSRIANNDSEATEPNALYFIPGE